MVSRTTTYSSRSATARRRSKIAGLSALARYARTVINNTATAPHVHEARSLSFLYLSTSKVSKRPVVPAKTRPSKGAINCPKMNVHCRTIGDFVFEKARDDRDKDISCCTLGRRAGGVYYSALFIYFINMKCSYEYIIKTEKVPNAPFEPQTPPETITSFTILRWSIAGCYIPYTISALVT